MQTTPALTLAFAIALAASACGSDNQDGLNGPTSNCDRLAGCCNQISSEESRSSCTSDLSLAMGLENPEDRASQCAIAIERFVQQGRCSAGKGGNGGSGEGQGGYGYGGEGYGYGGEGYGYGGEGYGYGGEGYGGYGHGGEGYYDGGYGYGGEGYGGYGEDSGYGYGGYGGYGEDSGYGYGGWGTGGSSGGGGQCADNGFICIKDSHCCSGHCGNSSCQADCNKRYDSCDLNPNACCSSYHCYYVNPTTSFCEKNGCGTKGATCSSDEDCCLNNWCGTDGRCF